jgi:hypothetical protein
VLAADVRQLQAHQRRLRRLAERLVPTGLISSGSVSTRYAPCGKPGCRCHSDPSQLHGPYWQWTTKITGKTVTRNLNQRQASLYQEWIANRRRLLAVLAEMEKVSQQAAEILLAEPHLESTPSAMGAVSPSAPTRRVARPLAESLVLLAELLEPVVDAAQEWLEAKDGEDHDAVAEARDRLLDALDESPALMPTTTRLARSLGSITPPVRQSARTAPRQPT